MRKECALCTEVTNDNTRPLLVLDHNWDHQLLARAEVNTLEDHLIVTQYILAFVRILQVNGSAKQNLQSILLTLVLDTYTGGSENVRREVNTSEHFSHKFDKGCGILLSTPKGVPLSKRIVLANSMCHFD
jgi:hypothetical protein